MEKSNLYLDDLESKNEYVLLTDFKKLRASFNFLHLKLEKLFPSTNAPSEIDVIRIELKNSIDKINERVENLESCMIYRHQRIKNINFIDVLKNSFKRRFL